MYTKRNYSVRTMVRWTRRYILLIALFSIIPVFLYEMFDQKWLHLPWLPIGLVGTALAFIIGFKNNASYGRLWEARKIWGGIVNVSRSFTLMINDFITNEHAETKRSEVELFSIRKQMVLRHIAWMTYLRHALRTKRPWESTWKNKSDLEYMKKFTIQEYTNTLDEELSGYVTKDDQAFIKKMQNKQTGCLTLQSRQLKELKLQGLIEDFRHMEIQQLLSELFTLQGQAERIKNFPYPRQFATLNTFLVWIFIALLPFGLMNEFDKIGQSLIDSEIEVGFYHFISMNFVWMSIPFSIIISWIFITVERVGDVSENPFEGTANDVPISTIARAIEIDIRQMIGDKAEEIPRPLEIEYDTQM